MKKWLKKILHIIVNVLTFVIILAVFFTIYSTIEINLLNKKYVNVFGYTFFEVASGSMAHTIEVDDFVIVKLTTDVKKNDIITYQNEDEFITHRLIKKKDNYYITKGDANSSEDDLVELNDVIGKVVYIVPKLGIWRKIIISPKVLVLIVFTIISFAIFVNRPNDNVKVLIKKD